MKDNHEYPEHSFRAGYVAIIGEPNVGKSTLLNTLVGEKISIVTPKPQTTRHKVLGILSEKQAQIIFLDTPGILKPQYKLHEAMMKSVHAAINDADVLFFMIDVAKVKPGTQIDQVAEFRSFVTVTKPVFLILNKIDLASKQDVASTIAMCSSMYPFKEIFPISALKQEGTEDLIETVIRELPEHQPFYPPDMISEHPERFFVSEIIREKIFKQFRDEIPYSTTVDIISFQEQAGRKDLINAEIYVERDSQKGILIGKQGKAMKEIGQLARKDIEAFLGRPVFLELHVKVREKWRQKESWLKKLGYTPS